jgi:hypothetical protein
MAHLIKNTKSTIKSVIKSVRIRHKQPGSGDMARCNIPWEHIDPKTRGELQQYFKGVHRFGIKKVEFNLRRTRNIVKLWRKMGTSRTVLDALSTITQRNVEVTVPEPLGWLHPSEIGAVHVILKKNRGKPLIPVGLEVLIPSKFMKDGKGYDPKTGIIDVTTKFSPYPHPQTVPKRPDKDIPPKKPRREPTRFVPDAG